MARPCLAIGPWISWDASARFVYEVKRFAAIIVVRQKAAHARVIKASASFLGLQQHAIDS